MKKYLSKKQLKTLEEEMREPTRWEDADHTVSYKGPTGIRFSTEILRKLHEISLANPLRNLT